MHLRTCGPEEADILSELAQSIYRAHYAWAWLDGGTAYVEQSFDTEQLITEMKQPGTVFYFIEKDDEWLGFVKVVAHRAPDGRYNPLKCMYLERLYLSEHATGQGIGEWVIDWVAEQARKLKISTLWLYCRSGSRVLSFYDRMGFSTLKTVQFEQYPLMKPEFRTFSLMTKGVGKQGAQEQQSA